jgi:hypothetical protein
MVDTTNGRGGGKDGEVNWSLALLVNMDRCGYVTPHHEFDRFMIVSYRFVTTLTATTIIQFLKSRSIRTVDLTMSTAGPQFFTNAQDITMINPVFSNYQYLGGE